LRLQAVLWFFVIILLFSACFLPFSDEKNGAKNT